MKAQRCPRSLLVLGLAAALTLPATGRAQAPAPAQPPSPVIPRPAANPADVESIEAILTALYASISGDAGVKRDWNRFYSLFIPGARLIPTGGNATTGVRGHRVLTPEEYQAGNGVALENGGFHEVEIKHHIDRYGHVAQVFSSYEARRKASDEKPFMRGINSIQLWFDGKRWWVVTIFWEAESPANPLPAEYATKP